MEMEAFRYQLVVQLPGSTLQDFDAFIRLEEALIDAMFDMAHEVDGHDFGSGTMNFFIHTNDPIAAFAVVKEIVNLADFVSLKAAYRSVDEDEYKLIWPENSVEEFNLI